MLNLDFNWEKLEGFLPVWEELSVDAREAFLMLVETQPCSLTGLGVFRQELKNAGLIYEMTDGLRYRLPEELRGLKRAFKAMFYTEVFSSSDSLYAGDMVDYLDDHFTSGELSRLGAGYYDRIGIVAQRAESVSWIEKFLSSEDELDWEGKINNQRYGTEIVWEDGSFDKTAEVVAQMYDLPIPLLVSAALSASELPASCFLKALHLGCRELLLFVDLCPVTHDFRVGLWPTIAAKLNAPEPEMPKSISATFSFTSPVLINDLYSLMSLCSAEPQRLRVNDGTLFAKSEKILFETMAEGPWWIPFEYELHQETRLRKAMAYALESDFLIGPTSRQRKNKPELKISSKGRQWTGLSEVDRLFSLWASLDLVEKRKTGGYVAGKFDLANFERCFPFDWSALESIGSPEWDIINNVFNEIIQELATATEDGFVDIKGFIQYVGRFHNPFNGVGGDELWDFFFGTSWWGWRSEEDMLQTWLAGVLSFLIRWGEPLGLIAIGTADPDIENLPDGYVAVGGSFGGSFDAGFEASGQKFFLCMKVTNWGRFILGLEKELEIRPKSKTDIIIQPNFEVVFLGASSEAEIRLTPIAERLGRGTGTLFRLTKASVQKAASTGMDDDAVLSILTEIASKPVPKNVSQQVCHWVRQAVLLQWRPAMVVTCPDHECALQVIGVVGKNAQLLSETTVEIRGGKPTATVVKKLQKVGIFLRAE
ncbi:MAG: hypothetical protein DRP93_07175 [Candidatus Neomarinimicrobiota bacterium]|nr:MAG: hypothetical protein DRP93_07175 [Candidatus Neomarinimicrobiota bacterium]